VGGSKQAAAPIAMAIVQTTRRNIRVEYTSGLLARDDGMTHISPSDRPREKLEQSGVSALGDNELLAVLIGHGTRGASALALANQLLALGGGTHGLTRLHLAQLSRIAGIGPAQAARVLAAVELGRRTLLTQARERPRFREPHELAQFLLPRYGAFPVERFGVVLLDTRYRLLSVRLVSVGSLDASIANPREVFREALLAGAAAVVVFHNHPSGDVRPSKDDVQLTIRLRDAGEVVGVHLVDHMILADTQYCSMRDAKVL
jgi:DNA repair protein RadC